MSTGKLFLRGIADMRRQPLPQLCTLLTVCMAAFLAGAGLLLVFNVQQEVLRTQGQARFQIYWAADANMTAVRQQWDDLRAIPGVAEVSTFTPRAALAEVMRGLGDATQAEAAGPASGDNATGASSAPVSAASERKDSAAGASAAGNATAGDPVAEILAAGLSSRTIPAAGDAGTGNANATRAAAPEAARTAEPDDFSWLAGENPLPPTALASFDIPPGEAPEPWMGRMFARLHNMDGVERVTYDAAQLTLAKGWIDLIQRSVLPAMVFFALVVALVVGNTMRLMMLSRKDEVEILELVGAKPWFIRAPLFANGLAQGFLGGTLSLFCLKFLQTWVGGLLDAPPLFLRVDFLPAWQCFALVFATTFVAGAAALLAARK